MLLSATLLDVYDWTVSHSEPIGQIAAISNSQAGPQQYNSVRSATAGSGVELAFERTSIWLHENTNTGEFSFSLIAGLNTGGYTDNRVETHVRVVDSSADPYLTISDDAGEAEEFPTYSNQFVGRFNYGVSTDGLCISGIRGANWTISIDWLETGLFDDVRAVSGGENGFLALTRGREYRITPTGHLPSEIAYPAVPGMTAKDIGIAPGSDPLPGRGSLDGDTWVVQGGGHDIYGLQDAFHYEYTAWTGDFDAVVRALSISAVDPFGLYGSQGLEIPEIAPWAKAAIMARSELMSSSAHVMAIATPGNGSGVMQGRDQAGFWSWSSANDLGPSIASNEKPPIWLRLMRHGDQFYSSWAPDVEGTPGEWSYPEMRVMPNMPDTLYVGLAVSSLSEGDIVEARFDGFRMQPFSGLPQGSLAIDVPGPSGGQGFLGVREVVDNGAIRSHDAAIASLLSGQGTIVDYAADSVNICDSDDVAGYALDDHPFGVVISGHKERGSVDNLSFVAKGTIEVTTAGDYTFLVRSDDGFRLAIDGRYIAAFDAPRPADNTFSTVYLESGKHDLLLTYYEAGGGAGVELLAAPGVKDQYDESFRLVGDTTELVRPAQVPAGVMLGDWQIIEATYRSDVAITNIDEARVLLDTADPANAIMVQYSATTINFCDPEQPGTAQYWNRDLVTTTYMPFGLNNQTGNARRQGTGDDNRFAMRAQGVLRIADPGEYSFGVHSDDGFALTIQGAAFVGAVGNGSISHSGDTLSVNLDTADSNTIGHAWLEPGDYPICLDYYENAGGGFVELSATVGFKEDWDGTFTLLGGTPRPSYAIRGCLPLVQAGPSVSGHHPSGDQSEAVSEIVVEFSEAIDAATFTAADIEMIGPVGPIPVDSQPVIVDDRSFRITFPEQDKSGTYVLYIGPNIANRAQVEMDQDGDGVPGEPLDDRYAARFTMRTAPYIIGHAPVGDVTEPVSQVDVEFSKPINSSTFSAGDIEILGPDGQLQPVGSPTHMGGNVYRVAFPEQTAYGTYHLLIGPHIADNSGAELDQDRDGVAAEPAEDRYDAAFTIIDVAGPRITGSLPSRPVQGPLDHLDVTFNEGIKADTFDPGDVAITGPAGLIAADSVDTLDSKNFRVHFPAQTAEGGYRFVIGPEIQDLALNYLDQDQDGQKREPHDQYTASVAIDRTPPQATGNSLNGVQNAAVRTFEVTFNEDMDPATFTPGLVTVAGPSGTRQATSIEPLAGDRFRVTVPAIVTDGAFHVTIAPTVADLAGNPLPAAYGFDFIQQLPDLVVSASVYPLECVPGQQIDIQWTVTNAGLGTATGTWTDVVSLSANAQGTGAVELTRLDFNQPLDVGQLYTRVATVRVPADASGSHWLFLTADATRALDETVETNNASVRTPALVLTTRPYPDLVVSDVSSPTTLSAGESTTIAWTVRNTGTGATTASYWYDELYLSIDASLSSSDIQLTRVRNLDFLGPGETYVQTVQVTVPDSVPRGAYYLIAAADVTNTVLEFDRENNNATASSGTAQVITPAPAFLTVTDVQVGGPLAPGMRPTFTWTVTNTGGTTITTGWSGGTGWDDGLALSRDQEYQVDQDYWLGSHTYWHGLPLRPGQSYTVTGRAEDGVPAWAPGTYYVIVIPDTHWGAGSSFGASTIGRDYGVAAVRLEYGQPDLAPVSLAASPAAVVGQPLRVDWKVQNQGAAQTPVASWSDQAYLSTDNVFDAQDTSLGSLSHNGILSAGANYLAGTTFTVPGSVVPGTYYVILKTDSAGTVPESNEANNVLVSDATVTITRIASDLQVVSANGPGAGVSGQSVQVDWKVINVGPETTAASSWTDAVYLSADATFDPATARLLKEFPHAGALDPQAAYSVSDTVPLPAKTEGIFHLFLVVDSRSNLFELGGEDNNVQLLGPAIEIADDQPDLAVASFAAPETAIAGRTIDLDWRIENAGTAVAAPTWKDVLYLTKNDVLKSGDTPLVTFTRTASLALGDGYGPPDTPFSVALPDGIEGTYYLFLVTDIEKTVYEKGLEDNNVVRQEIQITDLVADLCIQSATTAGQGQAGQFITVDYTTVNQGQEAAAGQWQDAFYLSADDQFDPDTDRLCARFGHNGPLGVGATYGPRATPAYLRLPDQIEGTYRMFVVADYANTVTEKDGEANNVYLVPQPITVVFTPADLVVSSVQTPEAAAAGTVVRFHWTVTNQGPQPTDVQTWRDGVYLSTDTTFEPAADVELGVVPHTGTLGSGESYTVNQDFALPQYLEGPYYVYVAADLRHQVYEYQNEDNNTAAAENLLAVAGVHADLQVSALDAPGSAISGSPVTVTWTVTNAGPDATPASSWSDGVYLSADDVLDASDTLLGTFPHNGRLPAGGSYAQSRSLVLPADATGQLHLIVKTDANKDEVYEYQAEDNNTAAAAIGVTLAPPADLQVTQVVAPLTAWSSQNVNVEWTVTNAGGTSAEAALGGWYDSVYLSRDIYVDPASDIRLGSVLHNGALGPNGEAYTGTLDGHVPAGVSGPYYILVATDSTDRVVERGAEDNNVNAVPPILQVNLTPPADLVPTRIAAPLPALSGEPAVWEYDVTNNGASDAVGSWYDTLYLSADQIWDIDDVRVARVLHQGDLAPGRHYTQTVAADCPPVVPGTYYLIVRTDILEQVRESLQDRANNTAVSTTQVVVDCRELPLGTDGVAGQLATGAASYCKVSNLPAGKNLVVNLGVTASGASTELYVRYGDLPTRSQYDFVALQRSTASQRVVVPTTQAGTYYVLVYGNQVPGASLDYSLRAELAQFSVYDTSYGRGGTAGNLTIEINGAGFDRGVTARLADGAGFELPAAAYYYVDGTKLYATFDLTRAAPGTYDVVVQSSEAALATVSRGLEVVAGGGGTNQPKIQVPDLVRWGREFQFTVTWGNDGLNDAPAPLLTVGGSQAFGFSPGDRSAGTRYTLLGTSTDGGPAGILRPGHRETMTFFTHADSSVGPFQFFVDREFKNGSERFDISTIRDRVRPDGMPEQEFDEYFQRLTSEIGTTNQDYLDSLARFASSSPLEPSDVRDPNELLQFQIGKIIAEMSTSISGCLAARDAKISVAGRTVSLRRDEVSPVIVTETLSDGTFTFSRLPAGTYQVDVNGLLLTSVETSVAVSPGENLSGLVFEVEKGATLAGRVRSSGSGVLGPASVTVFAGGEIVVAAYSTTDGTFELTGLAFGAYTVVIDRPGFARRWEQIEIHQDRLDVGVVEMSPGNDVSGLVRLHAGGLLQSGVVTLERLDTPSLGGFSCLVSSGNFTLNNVPEGVYNLAVLVDGVVKYRISNLIVSSAPVHLGEIVLSDLASIKGTILSQVAGLTVSDLRVGLFSDAQLVAADRVDNSGEFSLAAILPGNYTLQVIGAEDGVAEAIPVSLLAGQSIMGVELHVLPGGTISGTVRDTALSPLAGVQVTLIMPDGSSHIAMTGADGLYAFNRLPVGAYLIGVTGAAGFANAEISALTDSQSSVDVLVPGVATLHGAMYVDGTPLAGGHVLLFLGANPVSEAFTDEQGTYSFCLLQEGDYRVLAIGKDATFSAGSAVHIVAGDSTTLDIHAGDGSLELEILGPSGAFISGATVTLLSPNVGLLSTVIGTDGRVLIHHLVPGPYQLVVRTSDALVASLQVDIPAGQVTFEQLVMSQGFNLAGVVRRQDGSPVPDATVEVLDATTARRVGGAVANDAGEYQVTGLRAGTYALAVLGSDIARTIVGAVVVSENTIADVTADDSQADVVGRLVCGGSPVPFGRVSVYDAEGHVLGIKSADANGTFRVQALKAGGLRLVAAATGYSPGSLTGISVSADSANVGDIELLPVAVSASHAVPGRMGASGYGITAQTLDSLVAASFLAGPLPAGGFLQDWFFRLLDWISAPKECDEHTEMPDPISDPCLRQRCGAKRDDLVQAVQEQDRKYEDAEITSRILTGLAGEYYSQLTLLVADGAAVVAGLVAVAPGLSTAGFFAPTILGSAGAAVLVPLFLAVARSALDVQQTKDAFAAASSPEDYVAASSSAVGITGSLLATANDARNALIEAGNTKSRLLQAEWDYWAEHDPAMIQGLDIPGKIREVSQYVSRSLAILNLVTYIANTYITWNGTIRSLAQQLASIREQYNQKYREYEQAAHRARVYDFRLRGCLAENCDPCDSPNPPPDCDPCDSPNPPDDCGDGDGGGSHDPNDKLGPEGYDVFGYIAQDAVTPYTVRFENDPKATASAVLVTITDQLDSDLDWNTFQLGTMQFGSYVIPVPARRTYYKTRIDLRPEGNNLLVDVEGNFNVTTGLAQWTFTGIDPATGELTDDPLAGFLPPNNPDVHDGEGFVQYTLYPKSGLPTGTQITNTATIVFDWNEPIDTPTVKNTIDAGTPTSAVDPLPVEAADATFQVTWAGADDAEGCGVRSYDIYVSTDGGPYLVWLRGASATEGTFHGEFSRSYAFYSVATDNVGHREAAPAAPDATTRTPPGTASIGDRVWLDLDANGSQDVGEPGLGGVAVELRNAAGDLIASATTDDAGYYRFDGVDAAAPYYLAFSAPAGFRFSPKNQVDGTRDSDVNPSSGRTAVFAVAAGLQADWDAGLFQPAEVRGVLYDDANDNGTQDSGELGLAGRRVFIDSNASGGLDDGEPATVTGEGGEYRFTGLVPGLYVVGQVVPAWWDQSYPGPEGTSDRRPATLPLAFNAAVNVQAQGTDIQTLAYSVPVMVDWNNDGLDDLLIGEKVGDFGKVRVYLNQGAPGSPLFTTASFVQADGADLLVPATGCLGAFPRVVDWNGDGRKDLLVGLADGTVRIFLNVSTDAAVALASVGRVQVGQPGTKTDLNVGARAALDVADWNGDGNFDLVVGGLDGKVRVLLNEGTAAVPDFRTAWLLQDASGDLVVPGGRASVDVADVDGDGLQDLVCGNTDGQLYLYVNVGIPALPKFEQGERMQADDEPIALGTTRSRPFLHDFDGDGLADLVVGGEDGLVRLYTRQAHAGAPAGVSPSPPFTHTLHLVSGEVREGVDFGSTLVNAQPVADAGGPYVIVAGSALTLNGARSSDPDTAVGDHIVCYEWDLDGDGLYDDAAGPDPTVPWEALENLAWPADPGTGLPYNLIGLRVTDTAGATHTASGKLTITAVPAVVAAFVQNGMRQRSYVDRFELQFNQPMAAQTAVPCVLVNCGLDGTGHDAVPLNGNQFRWTAAAGSGASVLIWSLDGFTGGKTSLPDGYYELRVESSQVVDAYGHPLDGDGQDGPGGDYLLYFHVLQGDANGDTVVSDSDMALVNSRLGSRPGSTKWDPNADLNRSETVTTSDRMIVFENMNHAITAPASSPSGVVWTDGGVIVQAGTLVITGIGDLVPGASLTIGTAATVVLARGLSEEVSGSLTLALAPSAGATVAGTPAVGPAVTVSSPVLEGESQTTAVVTAAALAAQPAIFPTGGPDTASAGRACDEPTDMFASQANSWTEHFHLAGRCEEAEMPAWDKSIRWPSGPASPAPDHVRAHDAVLQSRDTPCATEQIATLLEAARLWNDGRLERRRGPRANTVDRINAVDKVLAVLENS